jgi:hypothetical protein
MLTPVLLLIWRRPHTLRKVIEALRPVAPKQLFVACDGSNPQRPGEEEKVAAVHAVVEHEIDWPCEIVRLYSDTNQGCKLGVSRAISWFFDQVEEGIILEDDCVPHQDFFRYCTTLLQRYRHDTRVWCISGNNFQDGHWRGDGSYYFSHYPCCWGWASWRRCWQHYDAELGQLGTLEKSGLMKAMFQDPLEHRYWQKIWKQLYAKGKPDTWDYQWVFTCMVNHGLTAIPNRNLVTNIGFGEGATHTTQKAHRAVATAVGKGMASIDSPSFILRDIDADRYSFDHAFGGKNLRFPHSLLRYPKRTLSLLRQLFAYGLSSERSIHG